MNLCLNITRIFLLINAKKKELKKNINSKVAIFNGSLFLFRIFLLCAFHFQASLLEQSYICYIINEILKNINTL